MAEARTLLLPCAGLSSRYPGVRPKWLLTLPDGTLALKRAAESVPEEARKRIVIAVRADHEAAFGCRAILGRVFGAGADVVVIDHDTRGPADTIAHMIRFAGVSGPIAIKDCDSFFDARPLPEGNFVSIVDVRTTPLMSNLGAKSYTVTDERGRITDLVEKSLASNFVCVGLYGCADAAGFLNRFDALATECGVGEIFVSHVLAGAIRSGEQVCAHRVEGLVDVGTLEEWRRYVRSRGTIVCDIDGVVFRNHSEYFAPHWGEAEEPIDANVAALRGWQESGAQLVFMTARPESYREHTQAALAKAGLRPHALIMDCHHGRRLLVNDHATSNPFPSAVGISVPRDAPTLGDYLKDWR